MELIKDNKKYVSHLDVKKWDKIRANFWVMRCKWNKDHNNSCEVIHVDFKKKEVKKREYFLRRIAA